MKHHLKTQSLQLFYFTMVILILFNVVYWERQILQEKPLNVINWSAVKCVRTKLLKINNYF